MNVSGAFNKGINAFNKSSSILRGTGYITAALLGIGTLTHFTNKASDKAREIDQKARLQRKQQLEDRRARKHRWAGTEKDFSPRAGEIVFEQFNNRIGHHRMGNSRF
jgi:hypothetical protein